MNSWLRLGLAIVIAWVLWRLVVPLVAGVLHFAVSLALLLLFCFAVSEIYRMLSREKI